MRSRKSSQGLDRSHPEASATSGSWAEGKAAPAAFAQHSSRKGQHLQLSVTKAAFCRSCSICMDASRHHQGMEMGRLHLQGENPFKEKHQLTAQESNTFQE